ncbi:DUF2269 family protein [Anaeromyxobacter oryzae]|uniref:DUF2269 family protein n=1 Tax=Anaeromyxobacter oryzae TaxID=2918170 RepID=A0ABM7WTT3_9BACT|nr:DUF2269 family protein [Anaeromyxobacter oryzae]BDG02879.1 hypothetical protein AMOR_18750 [Anaeromyxobacter oryzae]
MSAYPILLFIHVVGAVALFGTLAIEVVSMRGLRLADTPAEASVAIGAWPGRLAPLAMLATLVSGMGMMKIWGNQPWILTSFVGLVLMGFAGGAVTQRRIRSIRAALSAESEPRLSDEFRSARSGAALTASLRLRIAIGTGILGLMTLKPPDATTSALLLAASVAAGLIAAIPLATRRAPAAERPAA